MQRPTNLAGSPPTERQDGGFPAERRSHQRFPLLLDVRYRNLGKRRPVEGTGQTANVSGSGLLVSTEKEVREKSRLEIILEWPSLLNFEVPLQMVIEAKVVRTTNSGFAVAILRHEFRTKRPTRPAAPLSKA